MSNYYIKLAKYLDKIGKFSQADNVEKFIKSAQYTYTAPGLQSGPRMQYQGYLDATAQARQTAGFGAGLQQGVGVEGSIVGFQPLTPQQYYELAQQPGGAQLIFDYNKQLGEDIAKDAAQYTGPNRFQQFIGILSQRILDTPDPNMRVQIFTNFIEQPLIADLTTVIMNNPIQNIKVSINTLRNSNLNYFPAVNNNVIPTPTFQMYTQGFSPVQ
jgi:hypothetical protein